MIAIILYLSTTVFFPAHITLAILPLIVIRLYLVKSTKITYTRNEIIGFGILTLSASVILISNTIIGPKVSNILENSLLGDIPYIFLILLALILGKFLSANDLKIIQILIICEVLIGIIEYVIGVPTFFKNVTPIGELADSNLLYQRKVFGLSANSSVLASKTVYLATITLMQLRLYGNKFNKIIIFIVLIGLVITFNRAAIIAVCFSLVLFFSRSFKNILVLIFPLILLALWNWDNIFTQMTRGKNGVDYSGRDQIFSYFFNFWKENIFFGNLGTKLWWNSNGSIWHAHNSYLEFIASNGLFGSITLLIGLIMIFYKKNILVCLPILLYSMAQYGFLWGLSFYDVLFSAILFTYSQELKRVTLNPSIS